jgi:hypothetical protein
MGARGYILDLIIDSLELRRALGVYALVGLFVIGFGVALFFSVYVWPRASLVISKVHGPARRGGQVVNYACSPLPAALVCRRNSLLHLC